MTTIAETVGVQALAKLVLVTRETFAAQRRQIIDVWAARETNGKVMFCHYAGGEGKVCYEVEEDAVLADRDMRELPGYQPAEPYQHLEHWHLRQIRFRPAAKR